MRGKLYFDHFVISKLWAFRKLMWISVIEIQHFENWKFPTLSKWFLNSDRTGSSTSLVGMRFPWLLYVFGNASSVLEVGFAVILIWNHSNTSARINIYWKNLHRKDLCFYRNFEFRNKNSKMENGKWESKRKEKSVLAQFFMCACNLFFIYLSIRRRLKAKKKE